MIIIIRPETIEKRAFVSPAQVYVYWLHRLHIQCEVDLCPALAIYLLAIRCRCCYCCYCHYQGTLVYINCFHIPIKPFFFSLAFNVNDSFYQKKKNSSRWTQWAFIYSNGHVCRRYSNSNMQIDLTTTKKTPHANSGATLEHISATWNCDSILSQYAIHVLCRGDANGNGMIQRRITRLNVGFLSGSIYFHFIVSPSFCTACDRYFTFALRSILVIDLLRCCPRSFPTSYWEKLKSRKIFRAHACPPSCSRATQIFSQNVHSFVFLFFLAVDVAFAAAAAVAAVVDLVRWIFSLRSHWTIANWNILWAASSYPWRSSSIFVSLILLVVGWWARRPNIVYMCVRARVCIQATALTLACAVVIMYVRTLYIYAECRVYAHPTFYILCEHASYTHSSHRRQKKKKLQFESFSERTEDWVLSFSFYYFVCAFFPFLLFDAIEFASYLVRACFLYANNSGDEIEFRVFFFASSFYRYSLLANM